MDMTDLSQARFCPPMRSLRLRVPGLRDEAPPSEVTVYRMNPDGTKGEYLRIEPAFPEKKKIGYRPNG